MKENIKIHNATEYCELCTDSHQIPFRRILAKCIPLIPDDIITMILRYLLEDNEIVNELIFCKECNVCIPLNHCPATVCSSDPHHQRDIKMNHKICYECHECHIHGLPFCEKCRKCHCDDFIFCDQCNQCLPLTRSILKKASPSRRLFCNNEEKINVKFPHEHCASKKCSMDPHHIVSNDHECSLITGLNICSLNTCASRKDNRYCDKCKDCHAEIYDMFCRLCNICFRSGYASEEHCESPECRNDPHHIAKIIQYINDSSNYYLDCEGVNEIAVKYYWCKSCTKHWYDCSLHDKNTCNYQEIVDKYTNKVNDEYYLVARGKRKYLVEYYDHLGILSDQFDDEYSLDNGYDETNYEEEFSIDNGDDEANVKNDTNENSFEGCSFEDNDEEWSINDNNNVNNIEINKFEENDNDNNNRYCEKCCTDHHKEYEYCELCKKCLPLKIFGYEHCHHCITDPHHMFPDNMIPYPITDPDNKSFDKLTYGYDFFVKDDFFSIGIEKKEKKYCSECRKCHYVEKTNYCKVCDACYDPLYVTRKHCELLECIADPHHMMKTIEYNDIGGYDTPPEGGPYICSNDWYDEYYCDVCCKHWRYNKSRHCIKKCNYQNILSETIISINNNFRKIQKNNIEYMNDASIDLITEFSDMDDEFDDIDDELDINCPKICIDDR